MERNEAPTPSQLTRKGVIPFEGPVEYGEEGVCSGDEIDNLTTNDE
ncbi:hypothetical protein AVEN_71565-1, partial [Araneus ventricosus]